MGKDGSGEGGTTKTEMVANSRQRAAQEENEQLTTQLRLAHAHITELIQFEGKYKVAKEALDNLQEVFKLKMEDYKDVTKENYRLIEALQKIHKEGNTRSGKSPESRMAYEALTEGKYAV